MKLKYLALFLLIFQTAAAHGQDCAKLDLPELRKCKPAVKIVLGTKAGGSRDAIGRLLQGYLMSSRVKTIVANRGGANGNIAAAEVAGSSDNCTFLVEGEALGLNKMLHQFSRDAKGTDAFEPIGALVSSPLVLVSNPKHHFKDVKHMRGNFVTDAGAAKNPTIAVVGVGQVGDLAARQMVKGFNGATYNRIPMTSGGDATNLLLGDNVQFALVPPGNVASLADAGQLMIIGNTSNREIKVGKTHVPPMSANEAMKDVNANTYVGVFAPKNSSKAVNDELKSVTKCLVKQDSFRKNLEAQGYEILSGEASKLETLIAQDKAWQPVIADMGLDRPESERPVVTATATSITPAAAAADAAVPAVANGAAPAAK